MTAVDDSKTEMKTASKPEYDTTLLPPIELKYDPAIEIVSDEYKALTAGLTVAAKTDFEATIRDIVELNGTGDVAGVAASFIKESEYYQSFRGLELTSGLRKALSLAYNFRACGRGNGGLCAAAVRYALRDKFKDSRETHVHTKVPDDAVDVINDYKAAMTGKQDLVNFFLTNAISIAALAGALMNKTGHHWNSDHRAPQIAFVNSLGMKDHFQDQDYRKVFYLAIHPLPLRYTEELRADVAEGKHADVAEVVRLRAGGPPCGFGVINVCASAVQSLLEEPFMDVSRYIEEDTLELPIDADQATISTYIRRNREIDRKNRETVAIRDAIPTIAIELQMVYSTNQELCRNAGAYHMFATYYGKAARKFVDMVPLTRAMVLLAAYIMSKVGGTLARSPALAKYVSQHARSVQKAISAFNTQVEGESLYDIFSSSFTLQQNDSANPAIQQVNANSAQDGSA